MAGGSVASTGIVLEVLTKDNYLNWSTLVKNYLVGQGVWYNVVEGNINPDNDDPDWKSRNGKALHAIQLSCGYRTLSQIRKCKTAQEAWNHLKASFSEDVRAYHDIELGHFRNYQLDDLHRSVKRGKWTEVRRHINRYPEDIFNTLYSGKTVLHVAVGAGQDKIVKNLIEIGKRRLLAMQDKGGYTALALAAELTDNEKMAEWMVSEGGEELLSLTTKSKSVDDEGEIPLLLASANGHRNMVRYLFSVTPWSVLLQSNCRYASMLLSRCISAEIFDVAAALLQHSGAKHISLNYESDQCLRPLYALAHIPSAFYSGTKLNSLQRFIYHSLSVQTWKYLCDKTIQIGSPDGGLKTVKGGLFEQFQWYYQTPILSKLPGIKDIYEMKMNHYLVLEILKCTCQRIKRTSFESELRQWSAYDAMLQAAKYGIIEFIKSMGAANPDLLSAIDKNRRGILAHAILNRQEKVFKLIHEIHGQKEVITSREDAFGNNILHLAAELGPESDRGLKPNAALQMQRELQWFKAVESIVPRMCYDSKNGDDIKPRELFTKNHEQLVIDGKQWAKDTSTSFTIVGTLIITIMFAAAFTRPGGNNQNNGKPMFLGKDGFTVFIVADALSLITSSSSVLMFIGILTSRYAEEDFMWRLPLKLLFGLVTLFFSVASMMCAFCASLAIMMQGYRRIIVTAMLLAAIPILVFVPSLLHLCVDIFNSTLRSDLRIAKKKESRLI